MEKKIKKNLFVYKFTTFVILLSVFQTTLSNDVTNDEKGKIFFLKRICEFENIMIAKYVIQCKLEE